MFLRLILCYHISQVLRELWSFDLAQLSDIIIILKYKPLDFVVCFPP